MKMTKREKSLILIVPVLAILCVYIIYFLQPNLDEINTLQSDLNVKGIDVSNNDQLVNTITSLDNQIEEGNAQLLSYGNGIISGFDQPSIFMYIKESIGDNATKISTNFTDISPLGQLQVCYATVTMIGTYEGLKNILYALDNGKYLVKVSGLAMERPASETTSEPSEQDSATPTPVPSALDMRLLSIALYIEFYNYPGDVSPDTVYPFVPDSGKYGGDIFY